MAKSLNLRELSLRSQVWLATTRPGRLVSRWGAPLAITALAAAMRLVHLGFPGKLVFDETYYVKGGYSLLRFGYERKWPDDEDTEVNDANVSFEAGDVDVMLDDPEYVVHPPVGKWMIALGMQLFGADNPFGWRFSSALFGTISVLILILVGRRLFGSQTLGCVAGLLMAVDGQHLVHSRTGLLDPFLMFWALLAFWLILLDRDQMRKRLESRMRQVRSYSPTGAPLYPDKKWGPRLGMRWYLLGAGVALGLATGVKWSGLYFLAAFGILVVAWDMADRRAAGIRYWFAAGALLDGVKAFCLTVPVAAVTYLIGWTGWFASADAYNRHLAEAENYTGPLPNALQSLLRYHQQALDFHTGLTSSHPYQESALSWLIQLRPTSFYWGTDPTCGTDSCAQAITALGNPVIWWLGLGGLGIVLYGAIFWADRRAWAILAGYAGGYLPWFAYLGRTVFTFYTVAFVPFVVLALTYALGCAIGPPVASRARRRTGVIIAGTVVVLAIALAAFFWPIWTGESVDRDYWHAHMWLGTKWI
ncbi:MAG: phospholipid carrier-dependent glycosyltransferase [Bifidobacteriaceae bacterium]|nr:phospholipid carrier-dependent glycosyltransferase [Bifidobacteriaceae bacterium]